MSKESWLGSDRVEQANLEMDGEIGFGDWSGFWVYMEDKLLQRIALHKDEEMQEASGLQGCVKTSKIEQQEGPESSEEWHQQLCP